ncbi:MAG: transcriptional repressor LexA [Acetobacter sp.]|nr:transcriptional repressor LexA [Bacteroides sp.]MCM1340332.1 transcriptional repressor LexA [Acetobacter sp.]MCM1433021.1 transcriptional repressor LexA [Clostridiales bacterium]
MENLTEKQKAVFDYIKEIISMRGVAPSVREIGEAVGLRSTSSVQYNLNALEEMGYIKRDANLKRTIRIAGSAESVAHIPLLGTVTAGMPILATQQIEDYIAISGVNASNLFALHVKGDSMINAGIYDGDIIIVEQCPTADNGDIVVALIGDEATVKRFYKENGHFRLQPENDKYEPIIVDECVILGKIKTLIRSY